MSNFTLNPNEPSKKTNLELWIILGIEFDNVRMNMNKKLYYSALIFCVLVITNLVFAQDYQKGIIFDGPHIFYGEDSLVIKYYNDGNTNTFKIKVDEQTSFQGFLQDSTETYIIPQQFESPPDNYSNVGKIFVVSDVHGQYEIFKELLKSNDVINQNNSWTWGNGHLVILGDVLDKGEYIHEVLWLIYNLEQQAEEQGGKVHFLIGNHEVKALRGDLKYVKRKYFMIAESFFITVPELYFENTFWGRWLRSKNVLTQIESLLFVHGGMHPDMTYKYSSISEINNIMKRNLDMSLEEIKMDSTLSFLFRKDGPIRYRGFFKPDSLPEVSSDQLTAILNHFNVEKIIVGHTSEEHIYTSHNKRIICVDGGIKEGIRGEGLLINNGKYYRVATDGERELIFE